jgi:hypothetical protein
VKLAEEQRGLYFKSLEGGFTRQLAHGGVGMWPFASSRDARRIYYESDQSGQYEIWRKSLELEDAIPMTPGGGRVPRESPDGKHVYYAKPRADAAYKWVDVWKVPVEGGEEIPVLTGKLLEAPNWVIWRDVLIYRGWVSEYAQQGFINSYHLRYGGRDEASYLRRERRSFRVRVGGFARRAVDPLLQGGAEKLGHHPHRELRRRTMNHYFITLEERRLVRACLREWFASRAAWETLRKLVR